MTMMTKKDSDDDEQRQRWRWTPTDADVGFVEETLTKAEKKQQ